MSASFSIKELQHNNKKQNALY